VSLLASFIWSPIAGGITAPQGFKASGVHAGLKSSDKPDLALLLAPKGAVCAGAFTQSLVRAACVDLCIERLKATGSRARSVLINSGQANACTGDRGLIDSLKATQAVANRLGLATEEILICSTGVIGIPIPIEKLLDSIDPLVKGLSEKGGLMAANAILTTDLVEKEISFQASFGGRIVRLGGMAKGSGMIHPDMATMLAYLSCDARIPQLVWQKMIKKSIDNSFNVITVDGDTSTNDSVLAFSFGEPLEEEFWDELQHGLNLVTSSLAKAIARDGEGANCLLEVQVEGALNVKDAQLVARTIAASSLVKTAINGCDPNWGRIIAAAGRAKVHFELIDLKLWLGPYQLINLGQPVEFNRIEISEYLKGILNNTKVDDCVVIKLCIGSGPAAGHAWGCDLSERYVHINSDYTT
tara:strand:+ start:59 stop:1297 length:1239 start_codon:yes stop_codon:yes gene_type:complete